GAQLVDALLGARLHLGATPLGWLRPHHHDSLGRPCLEVERPVDSLLPAGVLVAGKYRIEHMVGRGGMGTVYAAQHVTLRQRVALKVLRAEAMVERGTVDRFMTEA